MNTNKSSKAGPRDRVPTRVWTVANILTLFRIALIFPFLLKIKGGSFGQALLIFFVASVTDFADGYVARKYAQHTPLGRFLDPLADKLLTTVGFVVMAIPHPGFPSIPLWLAVAVVGRDLLILSGSLVVYALTGFKDFKPTLLGKINTFLELGLIVVFLGFHSAGILIFLLPLCYAIVLVSVVASGGQYIIEGVRIARSHPRPRRL
jgi:cardiolipin synthase